MTASAGDLAAWLGQIWDEEERAAKFAHDLAASIDYGIVDFQWVRFVRDAPGGMVRSHSFDTGAPSPAAVLARIAADRKILALHQPDRAADNWYWLERQCAGCGRRWHANTPPGTPPTVIGPERGCPTLRLLASPYADRPGYQEAWRP